MFTLDKHGRGDSDISSCKADRQHIHILIVDGDLLVLLQAKSVILSNSDSDGFGARWRVGHQTWGKTHTLRDNNSSYLILFRICLIMIVSTTYAESSIEGLTK